MEFNNTQKSEKLCKMNADYLKRCNKEKQQYAERIVTDLKTSNPSKWYLNLISGQNKTNYEINLTELDGLYDKLKAEAIAHRHAEISNQYVSILNEDFVQYLDPLKFSPVTVEPEKIVKFKR